MSWLPAEEPAGEPGGCPALEAELVPRARDLGGFEVRRVLPAARRQMVGPFIFFDQMGPAAFEAGEGIDVRPHPHIGLATVTYLFDGELMHRDSLGSVQPIRPGELNWMTAGRGIVHSERTPAAVRSGPSRLAGIQSWVALPDGQEDSAPAFVHHGSDELPLLADDDARVRVIAGTLYGERAPVVTASSLFYAEVHLDPGASLVLPAEHEERAMYLVAGEIEIAGEVFTPGRMLLFRPGDAVPFRARSAAHAMLLGGEAIASPRFIWWNFVASSRERIEQAKADWRAGRFDPVPGDDERIPLPE